MRFSIANNSFKIQKERKRFLISKAPPPLKLSQKALIDSINHLKKQQERQIVINLRKGILKFRDSISKKDLLAAFTTKNYEPLMHVLKWEQLRSFVGIEPEITETMKETATRVIPTLPPQVKTLRFDIQNPRIVKAMAENLALLAKDITEETRLNIARVITQTTFPQPVSVQTKVNYLKNVVGLTEKQSQMADNYLLRLLEKGIKGEELDKLVFEYQEKLLDFRCNAIAVTENTRAINLAEQEVWLQAKDQGLVDPNHVTKTWHAVLDDRTSEDCASLHGTTINLEDTFTVPSTGDEIDGPPSHINCRCLLLFNTRLV